MAFISVNTDLDPPKVHWSGRWTGLCADMTKRFSSAETGQSPGHHPLFSCQGGCHPLFDPLNVHTPPPPPVPQNVTLIGKGIFFFFYRCNHVKMRSYWIGVSPNPMTGAILSWKRGGHAGTQGRGHVKMWAETGTMHLPVKGCQRPLTTTGV